MSNVDYVLFSFFKTYPEVRGQYFGFLNNLNEEELRNSPRLRSHASGVVLGVTQIINGLENPVCANNVVQDIFLSILSAGSE